MGRSQPSTTCHAGVLSQERMLDIGQGNEQAGWQVQ